ncbi:MAG TPA: efflux transporter outer membrane subunit [Acidobacteriaceae bacterium]|jgi:NodT family efflux transporter outer membrane factor (OMF) lipoprotein|nr:efflux transporter outer membrane subunit [Acidobacteriaceae bacterium]
MTRAAHPNTANGVRLLSAVLLAGTAILTSLLTGCMVGPNYKRPSAPAAPEFKEAAGWQPAQPADQQVRGKWWQVYGDTGLNAYEEQVDVSNQNLKVAVTEFTQARAAIQYNRSNLFPTLGIGVSAARQRGSTNRATYFNSITNQYNDFDLPLNVSWEPDFWGRIRRSVTQARENAQASAADVQNVRLSLQAELAVDYFQLRGLDAQKQILDQTVAAYEKSLQLTQDLFHGGLGSQLDVAEARTQLETTLAQDQDVGVARAQYEHAIAVLMGQPPSSFSIAPRVIAAQPPAIPVGLPSQLLERRPDIAAAERTMAAANEQIGITRAAYYPTFSLTGLGGFESAHPGNWFTGPSSLWSFGVSGSDEIVDWGRRHAQGVQAQAAYDGNVATYRQTVLTAYQEVEDNLAALRVLQGEAQTQQDAVAAAQQQEQIATSLYKGGLDTYLNVITAQSITLSNELVASQIGTRRMAASVLLIKALGGGWDVSQLPKL